MVWVIHIFRSCPQAPVDIPHGVMLPARILARELFAYSHNLPRGCCLGNSVMALVTDRDEPLAKTQGRSVAIQGQDIVPEAGGTGDSRFAWQEMMFPDRDESLQEDCSQSQISDSGSCLQSGNPLDAGSAYRPHPRGCTSAIGPAHRPAATSMQEGCVYPFRA